MTVNMTLGNDDAQLRTCRLPPDIQLSYPNGVILRVVSAQAAPVDNNRLGRICEHSYITSTLQTKPMNRCIDVSCSDLSSRLITGRQFKVPHTCYTHAHFIA